MLPAPFVHSSYSFFNALWLHLNVSWMDMIHSTTSAELHGYGQSKKIGLHVTVRRSLELDLECGLSLISWILGVNVS